MKRFLIFFTTIIFTLSSSLAKDLVVNSTPDKADVRITSLNGTDVKKAGETPFKIPLSEASATYANGADVFIVEVFKDGYETYRLVIPEFLKADLTLDVILTQRADLETLKKVDKSMADLFEAQRMIRSKNYLGALKKIDEVDKLMPKLSVTKELQAATYYLQNDYKKAFDYYQQAFAANTENLDAYKMILYLEKAMGIKKARDPAAQSDK